jgi:hypothetical protein
MSGQANLSPPFTQKKGEDRRILETLSLQRFFNRVLDDWTMLVQRSYYFIFDIRVIDHYKFPGLRMKTRGGPSGNLDDFGDVFIRHGIRFKLADRTPLFH